MQGMTGEGRVAAESAVATYLAWRGETKAIKKATASSARLKGLRRLT